MEEEKKSIDLPKLRFDKGHSFTRGVKMGPYSAARPQYPGHIHIQSDVSSLESNQCNK